MAMLNSTMCTLICSVGLGSGQHSLVRATCMTLCDPTLKSYWKKNGFDVKRERKHGLSGLTFVKNENFEAAAYKKCKVKVRGGTGPNVTITKEGVGRELPLEE